MSRHRGRPRPFSGGRFIWPRHCGCGRGWCSGGYGFSIWDTHVARTVAPR